MKTLIGLMVLFSATFATAAESINVPAQFQKVTVQASCKEQSCRVNEETGERTCRFKIFFDTASFEMIKTLKADTGLTREWYAEAPAAVCAAGKLPAFGQGTAEIDVLLYNLDMSVLTNQF